MIPAAGFLAPMARPDFWIGGGRRGLKQGPCMSPIVAKDRATRRCFLYQAAMAAGGTR